MGYRCCLKLALGMKILSLLEAKLTEREQRQHLLGRWTWADCARLALAFAGRLLRYKEEVAWPDIASFVVLDV